MSQAETPDPLRTLLKTIAEIVAYPAVLVSYVLALSERLPGQYPVTTSIATIFITTMVVVGWRWRAIRRQKGRTSEVPRLIVPAGARQAFGSRQDSLLDPVKGHSQKDYVYSLGHRRVESGILVGLIALSLGWAAFRSQAALREFENPLLSCSTEGEKELRVLIANIHDTGNQPGLLVEDRVYDFLSAYPGGQFQVCRWREAIPVRTRAKDVATSNHADMLIWGRRDVIYEIHLEVPAWESLSRPLSKTSSEEASSADFQLTEAEHLGYVIEFALSELIFLSGKAGLAQERLETALNQAKGADFAAAHKKDIAKGYFLLGLFYDTSSETNQPDSQKAIQAYSEALSWQDDLYAAVLNRGILQSYEGNIDGAIADYTLLIENDTPLKGSAYINRAFLQSDPQAAERDLDVAIELVTGADKAAAYFFRGQLRMDREDYQGAIDDLKKAVALDPQGFYNYHLLGTAQLYAGQADAARETYHQIIPTLDDGSRQQVLEELGQVAEARPDLKPVINEITADLKAARLPETSP